MPHQCHVDHAQQWHGDVADDVWYGKIKDAAIHSNIVDGCDKVAGVHK